MTNRIVLHTVLVSLLAALVPACTADEPPPPTKVYDFAGIRLADSPVARGPGPASIKTQIRDVFAGVRPQLLACVAADPAVGTLGVVIDFAGGVDRATTVESVRFDAELADRATLTSCFREVLAGMTTPVMSEDAVWQVHYPIVIGR